MHVSSVASFLPSTCTAYRKGEYAFKTAFSSRFLQWICDSNNFGCSEVIVYVIIQRELHLTIYIGKIISNKKEELINILDHCGIQVDNPVSLLNQDTSRHFLQKSKPGDKYKLFMKATRLEQIASDYEQAEQDQAIMKEAIKRQKNVRKYGLSFSTKTKN